MPQPLVHPRRAMQNSGNDVTLVEDLAEVFLLSAPDLSNELRLALAHQDWETLARTAHSFKSPLGFFGAEDSVKLAEQLEAQADAGTLDNLQELADQLLASVDQVRCELTETDFRNLMQAL